MKIQSTKYVTYREICNIVNQMEDYRDKVILMLIFDGFYTDIISLQGLRESDLVVTTRYKYLGDKRISGQTVRLIHKALEEKTIHTFSQFNGGVDELISSDYILRERQGFLKRVEVGETFNGYSMNRNAIINRFSKVKRHYGFKFTMSSLYASGCIYRAVHNVDMTAKKHRTDFLKYLKEEEGVDEGMGYLYYKYYMDLLPRYENELKQEKASE